MKKKLLRKRIKVKMAILRKKKVKMGIIHRQDVCHQERLRIRKLPLRSKTSSEENQNWMLTQLRSSQVKQTKTTKITKPLWMI